MGEWYIESYLIANVEIFSSVGLAKPRFNEGFGDTKEHTMEIVSDNTIYYVEWWMNCKNWYSFIAQYLYIYIADKYT